MNRDRRKLSLYQPAYYQIEIVGHLNAQKATWFEGLTLDNEYGEDGTPVTVITGEVLDQAVLHGLLTRIRDLGLPLLSVVRIESSQTGCKKPGEKKFVQNIH
ncbi:MAG: hypothetical protein GY832_28235 [Chloroflexi bacterium]|nr:hypothetical protein [Chloroflexota bacterium]